MAERVPNLNDRTNFFCRERPPTGLPTPPSERKRLRQLDLLDGRGKKRLKFEPLGKENGGTDDDSSSESDGEEDAFHGRRRVCQYSVYGLRNRAMVCGPSGIARRVEMPTRSILQTFVSSQKSDVYKCQSIDQGDFLTPPYACSYTHAAKLGGPLRLAVATEQGTVHILDTSQRRDWDPEPQRVTFQPHENGIFDIQWSPSDNLLATASGDQSVRVISSLSSNTLQVLRGHEGTVKCVTWDPNHDGQVLCSGGRDGSICLWDLRAGEDRIGAEDGVLAPVLSFPKAHGSVTKVPRPKGRRGRITPTIPLKSITHLVYTDSHPYGIVSSSSFDGILNLWDVRLPTFASTPKKSARARKTPARARPLYTSSSDPTTYSGTRRGRGITTLALGSGPTAGLLYALGTDSRVHTYDLPWLEPLSGHVPTLGMQDPHAHTDARMTTNSFFVRLAASPCGRWLASGNAVDGQAYLFDVASAASAARARDVGRFGSAGAVQLKGQTGEVGAMDWADGALATCSDDGTVRVWRPDVEIARRCASDPEEMKWEWSWAVDA